MGLRIEMDDHTREAINAMHGQVALALDAIGKAVLVHVDFYVPKDTGRLANSMTHIVDTDRVTMGTDVPYGKYVEYREELHHAAPTKAHYLRDSIVEFMDEYREILRSRLKSDL